MSTEQKLHQDLCNCERPVDHCKFAKNCQVINQNKAKILRLNEDEIFDIDDKTSGGLMNFANAVMDALIKKNGWLL